MQTIQSLDDGFVVDRRSHHHLRSLYGDARVHIAHFFHDSIQWADSPIDYLAQRLLHETYPQLSSKDVRLLVNAIERQVKLEAASA